MRPSRTGLLNVGIGAMPVASLLGGVIFSANVVELADRWYRALTGIVA